MSAFEENILEDEKALARFQSKIVKNDDPDGCWDVVNMKKDKNGCGIFGLYCHQLVDSGKRTWKSFRAPRLQWIIIHNQEIPKDKNGRTLYVLHNCDNETCLNPKHIYLGTQKDNMDDRRARGRFDTGPKGVQHPNSKLTDAKVRKICHLYFVKGATIPKLANQFKVSTATIGSIVRGETWKHISKTHIPRGFKHKYERCQIRNNKAYQYFKTGASYQEVADKYKMNIRYVRCVIRKIRKDLGLKPLPLGFDSKKDKAGR